MTRLVAPPRPRILFIDDEADLADALRDYFDVSGFDAKVAGGARAAREILTVWTPDVLVIDIDLGRGEDGFSLAASLSQGADPPAMLFLSGRAETIDRVLGLELGADDFIAKPVALRELLARVRRILERRAPAARRRGLMRVGTVAVDVDRQTIIAASGEETTLGPGEFALLKCFLDAPGETLSRDALLERAPATDEDVLDRAIDRRIARLRRKLGETGDGLIEAVRGAGYRLAIAPNDAAIS